MGRAERRAASARDHDGPNMTKDEARTPTTAGTAIVFCRHHLTRGGGVGGCGGDACADDGGGIPNDAASPGVSPTGVDGDGPRDDRDRERDCAWECPYWRREDLDAWTDAAATGDGAALSNVGDDRRCADDRSGSTADDADAPADDDPSPPLVEVPYDDLLRAAHASASALTDLWRARRGSTSSEVKTLPSKEGAAEESSIGGGTKDRMMRSDVPTIAIAIPEGPLLPLAVLAVHVMQCGGHLPRRRDTDEVSTCSKSTPSSSSSATSSTEEESGTGAEDAAGVRTMSCGAILVPLDPGEGAERLGHVLRDCRPDLVLAVPGCDADRIRSVVSELRGIRSGEGTGDAGMAVERTSDGGDTNAMHVVDFAGLVRSSVRGASGTTDGGHRDSSIPAAEDVDQYVNEISHIVYTSGTTGRSKGCKSSLTSLRRYIRSKNDAHGINGQASTAFLASGLSFDPCFSDVLATFHAGATLAIAPRSVVRGGALGPTLRRLRVTHVLCTPTLWKMVHYLGPEDLPDLEVVALGGEPIPRGIVRVWARRRGGRSRGVMEEAEECGGRREEEDAVTTTGTRRRPRRLLATYGVTEACVYQTCGEVFFDPDPEGDDGGGGGVRAGGRGQDVGKPFPGVRVDIFREGTQLNNVPDSGPGVGISAPRDSDDDAWGGGKSSSSRVVVGEVVLSGGQLDRWSGYLNLLDLTAGKFSPFDTTNQESCASTGEPSLRIVGPRSCSYRTGDRGFVDPGTGHLHILGRIDGEDGMVKFNGVRVELGEIETAIQDACRPEGILGGREPPPPVVLNCIVSVEATTSGGDLEGEESKKLIAYCILSVSCLEEIGVTHSIAAGPSSDEVPLRGIVCPPGPLATLLMARCKERVPRGCAPSTFVIIDRMPLSPTGKCDKRLLPPLGSCSPFSAVCSGVGASSPQSQPLWEYGRSGGRVTEELVECLNLRPCQRSNITTSTSFALLGGDSLAATRVARALYASHHGLHNSRLIGGSYGMIEGPFAVSHLVRAANFREYVDWLDSNGAFQGGENGHEHVEMKTPPGGDATRKPGTAKSGSEGDDSVLFNALLEATLLGQTNIAVAILALGLDPNFGAHGGRIGKVSSRIERRKTFVSNPLHLACIRGDDVLVRHLVNMGCKCNSPDASGSFPLHLACASHNTGSSDQHLDDRPSSSRGGARSEADHVDVCARGGEATVDLRRRECVRILVDEGKVSLSAKDGNKQTVLHCAARAGHCELLKFLMERWREAGNAKVIRIYESDARGRFDWRDRWFRTPVHWAVLNGNVDALRILLENGCTALPEKPKCRGSNRRTSVAIETPMEICERLFGTSDGKGLEICNLLSKAP